MDLTAVSRSCAALELFSEAPMPRTMSPQPVARVTSLTEMVSRALGEKRAARGENGGREEAGILRVGVEGREGGGDIWGVGEKHQVRKKGLRDGREIKGFKGLRCYVCNKTSEKRYRRRLRAEMGM